MGVPDYRTYLGEHGTLVDDLTSLTTAEERLAYLMERAPLHVSLEPNERVDSRKVPGCLSGLWLKAMLSDGRYYFSAYSESTLVHGVVSYICDLYSGRTPVDIVTIGSNLIDTLKIESLLSITRKRAVSSTVSYILATARGQVTHQPASEPRPKVAAVALS